MPSSCLGWLENSPIMQLFENNIDSMKQSNPQNVADSDVLRVFMA